LDAAVTDAYGWPVSLSDEEILSRLVALNAERAEEEKEGNIRWLRPDYQKTPKAERKMIQDAFAFRAVLVQTNTVRATFLDPRLRGDDAFLGTSPSFPRRRESRMYALESKPL